MSQKSYLEARISGPCVLGNTKRRAPDSPARSSFAQLPNLATILQHLICSSHRLIKADRLRLLGFHSIDIDVHADASTSVTRPLATLVHGRANLRRRHHYQAPASSAELLQSEARRLCRTEIDPSRAA